MHRFSRLPSWRLLFGPCLVALVLTAGAAAGQSFPLPGFHAAPALAANVALPASTVLGSLAAAVVAFMCATEARLRHMWRRASASNAAALRQARLDPLTGLANYRALLGELQCGAGTAAPPGLILLDIDGFRALRNANGRRRADALLREFACRLSGVVPATGTVARIHGDEFGVALPARAGDAVQCLCEQLLRVMMQPYYPDGRPCQISVSIGAVWLPAEGQGADASVNAAQLALEQAKQSGGASWRMFEADMAEHHRTRTELRAELRPALATGQFVPYYQPIIHLASGEIHGFEVLARWLHPDRGVLLPVDFIGLAEEQHQCALLSLSLLRQVIRDAANWPAAWRFAFNAAPSQLRELIDFVHDAAQLPQGMMDPQRIELEITENALITDMELARDLVNHMHRGGSRVVLDDFGTGYANFRHLRELDVDGVKIDKSFVFDMLDNPRSEACVRAILSLGQSLHVAVTAEGVETAATAARLHDLGCQYAQGYLFARPMPAADVAGFAEQQGMAPKSVPCASDPAPLVVVQG